MKVDKTKQKICRLEDICVVRTGRKDANHASDNGEYPFFTCGTNPLKSTTYSFDGENLIIPGNGDIGRCFYYNGKIEAYQRTYVLHLKENSNIDIKYLYLVFKAGWKLFVKNKILGAAMPYIKLGHLNSFPITIYELGVQKAIATELDSIQTMIDGYNAQLADLDALAESIFFDTFGDPTLNEKGWGLKKLCEVCEVTSSKRIYQSEQTKSGVPFYRISDFVQLIRNEMVSPELYISHEKYNELKSKNLVPCKNDILITSRGTLGLCYVIKRNDCFYFQDGMITWLKNIKEGLSSTFLSYIFRTSFLKRQMQKIQNGSTVSYLSISMIKGLDIIIPPLLLQQQFVEIVESIELQKELIRQQLTDAEQLMGERMQYYFS